MGDSAERAKNILRNLPLLFTPEGNRRINSSEGGMTARDIARPMPPAQVKWSGVEQYRADRIDRIASREGFNTIYRSLHGEDFTEDSLQTEEGQRKYADAVAKQYEMIENVKSTPLYEQNFPESAGAITKAQVNNFGPFGQTLTFNRNAYDELGRPDPWVAMEEINHTSYNRQFTPSQLDFLDKGLMTREDMHHSPDPSTFGLNLVQSGTEMSGYKQDPSEYAATVEAFNIWGEDKGFKEKGKPWTQEGLDKVDAYYKEFRSDRTNNSKPFDGANGERARQFYELTKPERRLEATQLFVSLPPAYNDYLASYDPRYSFDSGDFYLDPNTNEPIYLASTDANGYPSIPYNRIWTDTELQDKLGINQEPSQFNQLIDAAKGWYNDHYDEFYNLISEYGDEAMAMFKGAMSDGLEGAAKGLLSHKASEYASKYGGDYLNRTFGTDTGAWGSGLGAGASTLLSGGNGEDILRNASVSGASSYAQEQLASRLGNYGGLAGGIVGGISGALSGETDRERVGNAIRGAAEGLISSTGYGAAGLMALNAYGSMINGSDRPSRVNGSTSLINDSFGNFGVDRRGRIKSNVSGWNGTGNADYDKAIGAKYKNMYGAMANQINDYYENARRSVYGNINRHNRRLGRDGYGWRSAAEAERYLNEYRNYLLEKAEIASRAIAPRQGEEDDWINNPDDMSNFDMSRYSGSGKTSVGGSDLSYEKFRRNQRVLDYAQNYDTDREMSEHVRDNLRYLNNNRHALSNKQQRDLFDLELGIRQDSAGD